jgi:dTDP-4-dehydrorhamnose reductase
MKILVLGVTGMLGNAMFRYLSGDGRYDVYGSARGAGTSGYFAPELASKIVTGVDVESHDSLVQLFGRVQPNLVINCIGLIKQLSEAKDPLVAIPINAMLPHRLARLGQVSGARLIHISTDCVFSGSKGNYLESDPSDAEDLYGRSKYLGEVDYPNAITLRTSIIGPELGNGARGLLGWFLSQQNVAGGYTRAIFSGVPTVELARVINEFVIPRPALTGVFHVASEPISKHELLQVFARVYKKTVEIRPIATPVIDRSLNAERFREATGYIAAPWPELVEKMYRFG